MARPKTKLLSLEQILSSAEALAEADSLEHLSLSRLADWLGVRPPSLYRYISNRQDLYRQLSLKGLRDLGLLLQDTVAVSTGEEAVLELCRASRVYARAHPILYRAATMSSHATIEEVVAAGEALDVVGERVLLEMGVAPEQLRVKLYLLRCCIHGFVSLELNNLHPDEDLDGIYAEMVSQLVAIIRG